MELSVRDLTADGLAEPLGLPLDSPSLSWRLESEQPGTLQASYRIVVTAGDEPVWDSGRVASSRSVHVLYAGPPLRSRTRYDWTVEVETTDGRRAVSAPSWWETGLAAADWQGDWITYVEPDTVIEPPLPESAPSPYLRRELELPAAPRRARLYATAAGLYEASVNGERVGREILAPGWTDYDRRARVQAYDVTALLRPGANVLQLVLGDGWFAGNVGPLGRWRYGDHPAALVQLEVELEDGVSLVVASDESWQGSYGPVRSADVIMGERVDHTVAPGPWAPVQRRAIAAEPVAAVGGGVEVVGELAAKSVVRHGDGFVVDFGANVAGRVRLDGVAAEGVVSVRHAEMLDEDGSIYVANLRSAKQLDEYVLAGPAPEPLAPRFTYHGFRYAEVRGLDELPADAIRAEVLSSAVRRTGSFRCSDELLDRLQENIVRSQLGNSVSIPTDCPQRDERLGWTGDVVAFAATAAFNVDVLPFFRKWLVDLDDAQFPNGAYPDVAPRTTWTGAGNAGWAEVGVLVPWTLYRRYGDERLLADRYDGMRRFMEYLERDSTGWIRDAGRYGDWVALGPHTPKDLIGTAYVAATAATLAEIAATLGEDEDAGRFGETAAAVRRAFADRFLRDDGSLVTETQTGYLLVLAFGLVPEELRAHAVARLVADIEEQGRLNTGFLGTPLALPVLSDHGQHELACRLAQRREYPSWLFSVRHGATTIWERWDGWTTDGGFKNATMNSFNHYALGSVGDWLYRYVGGLDLADGVPGYAHAVVRPRPGGSLTEAALEYDSVRGRFAVAWTLRDGTFSLDVTVPANAVADVVLPYPDAAGETVHRVGSGRHAFAAAAAAGEAAVRV
ncbi:MAG TPA: family 78 glycoside hydrolase catalytic domain [Gaiellaceae bacterium]|nr:family 78 glycoside hydrolase catalytic domain [Gaiellaceae bacterium]